MKPDLELEKEIYNIFWENLSSDASSEVTEELVKELIICIRNKDSIWAVLNDNLTYYTLDELEYESKVINRLNSLMEN